MTITDLPQDPHKTDQFGRVVYVPQAERMSDLFGGCRPFVNNEKDPEGFYASVSGERPPEIPMSHRLTDPTEAVEEILAQMNGICEDPNIWVQVIVHGDVCSVCLKYNLILGKRLLATIPVEGFARLVG